MFDAFIAEVRSHPQYIAAAASAQWPVTAMDDVERGLTILARRADSNPGMVDAFDAVCAVTTRRDLSLKERLLAVAALLRDVRDAEGMVH